MYLVQHPIEKVQSRFIEKPLIYLKEAIIGFSIKVDWLQQVKPVLNHSLGQQYQLLWTVTLAVYDR